MILCMLGFSTHLAQFAQETNFKTPIHTYRFSANSSYMEDFHVISQVAALCSQLGANIEFVQNWTVYS